MVPACMERGVRLLAYGTLAGGFLSDAHAGAPEPPRHALATASLQKYKRMIDAWGGWSLFQDLMVVLGGIARKHGASIANVATRYIMDKPAVAGIIIGARLGISDRLQDTTRLFSFRLDESDVAAIDEASARGRDIHALIGDCGDEYR